MKQKHLTEIDRAKIELMLNQKSKFAAIARELGKNPTTISKEVRLHRKEQKVGAPGKSFNNCKNQYGCGKQRVCLQCVSPVKYKLCRRCSQCNKYCSDYEPQTCTRHEKAPYVCNGCGKRAECSLTKYIYSAKNAENEYKELLSTARSGHFLCEEEVDRIDRIVSPLIRQHQSPHHICATNRDELMVSERTLYRLIEDCLIRARNMDLPRKLRFRARAAKPRAYKVDKSCRIGRTYDEFQAFMEENPDCPVVQLDSVEGKRSGKVLLTVHFVRSEMMLAFLREANTAKSVTDIFESLYLDLGDALFKRIFRVCLADNGSEFSNPKGIEFNSEGQRRTRLFYCDPSAPYQKGSAERNHEFIRYFIPKGTDLEQYTQADITLMMNHINSYSRESLEDKCPYEVFEYFYGRELLDLLGCETIPARNVTLGKSAFSKEASV